MATAAEFYNDPDWEGSSGPIIPRTVDASEDLWPVGTGAMGEIDGGDKDVLADGLGAHALEPYHDRVRETVLGRLDAAAKVEHHRQLA